MQGFYARHPELGDGPTLTVQVLTTGSWPSLSSVACNLPVEMLELCEKFQSYYLGIHTGRRLTWQTNMGTADLKATFGKGQRHELHVSTYQMCVLMLFNDADRLSYNEIEQVTEIPASDLKRYRTLGTETLLNTTKLNRLGDVINHLYLDSVNTSGSGNWNTKKLNSL
ncbi:hypothetical protein RYX36_032479 [Vicia faba]